MNNGKTIKFGEGVATIKSGYSSKPDVVNVLGHEKDLEHEKVYLDSLVHRHEDDFEGWVASGAISTILTRPLPADVKSGGSIIK